MSEQNPSAPLEMVVHATRAPDDWWQSGGSLRMGHWVSITVYRFGDPRSAKSPGGALPLSGKGDNSAREYGVQGMFSRQVFTFQAQDAGLPPGTWGNPQFVGPVKTVRTSKRMGAASGQFTVITKPFAEWAPMIPETSVESEERAGVDSSVIKYVDSGDWIEIVVYKSDPRLKNSSSPLRTLMVGKVDSVHLDIRPAPPGGSGGSSLRIEGRDVGAVYEDTILYFNPYDPYNSNPEGRDMATVVQDIAGAPGDIVLQMLGLVATQAVSFGLQASTPDAGLWTPNPFSSPINFADTVIAVQGPTRGIVYDPALLSPGQSTPLWNFVDTYGVTELNEVWVDTVASEAGPQYDGNKRYSYVFVREKPFVNLTDKAQSPWFFLPSRVIHLGEIKTASLSRGDNRYNYVNVLIELPPTFSYDAFALCSPVYNLESVARHGLLKLDMTLGLNAIVDAETDSLLVTTEIRQLRDLVLSWNLLNAYYYSGTIELQGIRADIRVGSKIVVEGGQIPHMENSPFTATSDLYDRNATARPLQGPFTAYVEAVQHQWSAGTAPQATTSLTVSRGYRDDRRLPDMQTLALGWSEVVASASATSTSNVVYDGSTGDGSPT